MAFDKKLILTLLTLQNHAVFCQKCVDNSNPTGGQRNSEKIAIEQSGEKWRNDRIGRHHEKLLCVQSNTKS